MIQLLIMSFWLNCYIRLCDEVIWSSVLLKQHHRITGSNPTLIQKTFKQCLTAVGNFLQWFDSVFVRDRMKTKRKKRKWYSVWIRRKLQNNKWVSSYVNFTNIFAGSFCMLKFSASQLIFQEHIHTLLYKYCYLDF